MKFIALWLCITTCMLVIVESVWSHGVRGRIDSGSGTLVEAKYDDGEPISYAGIEIFDPEGGLPFQTGRTDRNGRFLFYPDMMGNWKVVVNDGTGHRLVLKTEIDSSLNIKETNERHGRGLIMNNSSFLGYARIIVGISIIFGIFGSLLGWACYKRMKDNDNKKKTTPE
ncbi:MAG: hypothetical protein SWO11_00605 [Thermodesulfobacteriota bacterium]|nr:hypothetical protein [Thermodesulfobacteriota bacterium]